MLHNSDILLAAMTTIAVLYPLISLYGAARSRAALEFSSVLVIIATFPWALAVLPLGWFDQGMVYAVCMPLIPLYAVIMARYIGCTESAARTLGNPLILISLALAGCAATNPLHNAFALFDSVVIGRSTHELSHIEAHLGLLLTQGFALLVTIGTLVVSAIAYVRSRCTITQVLTGLILPVAAMASMFHTQPYLVIFGYSVSTFLLPCLTILAILNYHVMRGDMRETIPVSPAKLIRQMPDAVAVVDADGRVSDCNPAFAKLIERDKKDLVRRKMGYLIPDQRFADGATIALNDAHFDLKITEFEERKESIWVMRDVTDTTNALLAAQEQHAALLSANQELERLSTTDPLTGLWNRRFFERQLEEDLATQRRSRSSLGLLLVDIDHFKQINDRYGHQMGDNVLQELADIMLSQCRAGDVLCRIGGEEFAVLLTNTETDGVAYAAERIRSTIATHTIQTPDDARVSPTVSIGGLTVFPGEGVSAVIRAADQELYQAKHQGRNSVSLRTQDANLHVVS